MNKQTGFLSLSAAFLLAACGGGGGGGSSPPAPNPAPPPAPSPPVITGPPATLPAAIAGTAVAGATITATGATPITYSVSAGSLPGGMALNANTGMISGTPLVLGTFNFTVTATNSAGAASAPFSQLVNPAIPNANLLLSGNRLVSFNTNVPTALEPPVDLRFLAAGHEIVAIVRRPNNGFLYGFAVDGVGYATVYALHPANGAALQLGSISGFADGSLTVIPIAGTRFGAHVSPAADVLRIATDTGQNFRFNLNTGKSIDADPMFLFAQMDAPLNGATTRIDSLAYTNNTLGANASTLYVVDSAIDALCIQEPANNGTIGNCQPLSTPLDAVLGFDIAPGINTNLQGTPVASGSATAVIRLPAETTQRLAQIDLTNGSIASNPPAIGNGEVRSLAIQAPNGIPMYALAANGTQLVVFTSVSPSSVETRTITGIAAGEEVVGIDFNPQNGLLMALAVNAALDAGSVYIVAPQTGGATLLNSGGVALVTDAGAPRDLPQAGAGYGFDIDPANGRIRVVTGTGLNFRIAGGTPLDGNPNAAGIQADADISPSTALLAGLAYTNGLDVGDPVSTAYVVSYTGDEICRLAPANTGTLTGCLPLLLPGASIPIPLGSAVGFDIPGDVRAAAANEAVSAGTGYMAAFTPSHASSHLFEVNLATGGIVDRGTIGDGSMTIRGLAVGLAAVR